MPPHTVLSQQRSWQPSCFRFLDGIGAALSPVLQYIVPTVGPLAGDINKPHVSRKTPQDTCRSSTTTSKTFWITRRNLANIQSPLPYTSHSMTMSYQPHLPIFCAAPQERGVRYRDAPKQLPRSGIMMPKLFIAILFPDYLRFLRGPSEPWCKQR